MESHAIETARLRLRPCRIDDLQSIHKLWTNDHIRHFLFDEREVSMSEARSFIEASVVNFEEKGYGLWLVFLRDRDSLAGFAGFLRSEDESPNLIYGIHPDFCRAGYATEAVRAVLNYGLQTLGLPGVRADVDEPNTDSVRVLEKLGLKLKDRREVNGRPLRYYYLSNQDSGEN